MPGWRQNLIKMVINMSAGETGVLVKDGIHLHYDEYGTGERIILSAQVGFYPDGMQQALSEKG